MERLYLVTGELSGHMSDISGACGYPERSTSGKKMVAPSNLRSAKK